MPEQPNELSPRYDPHEIEQSWYRKWESHHYFECDVNSPRPSFSVVIPPPNITGVLHMGHALNNTLQDVLVRWKRMAGFNALWVPGTDHASIATQYVVERKLRDEGMDRPREQLGREKFLERVWEWKQLHGGIIVEQLKRLGTSCDWRYERFTMDEGLSRAVRHVFARLYNEGLIYRGNYLVNWCPRCQTTLADDEVDYADKVGKLWYVRYPIEGEKGRFAVVATTRPETMLGDTAVAVNPSDDRYRDLIGKHAILPLVIRRIPIIADDFVDREFGTGMVKITPAHDPNDYAAGKRHGLEEINIFTPDAHVNANGGKYEGLERYAARKRVLADLHEQGLIEREENHQQRIGTCYRCHTVIEPYISLQWFVKMAPLAAPARKAVEDGRTKFYPESRTADYYRWLDSLRDWAISRQLWWGHQIPAFYKADGTVIVPQSEEEYQALRNEAAEGKTELRQDDDVLDTWFSSALWPFSTLGWPEQTKELKVFYPTSVLVTAKDIIFFWVARMIMMGLHFMDDVPFHDVYFNPIVGDEHGKKMSKSKGNVLDPLDLIEQFGTDSLRFTLTSYASREQHIAFSLKETEGYRNFMNKIWNASRLILANVSDLRRADLNSYSIDKSSALEDRWIVSRYAQTVRRVNEALPNFDFDIAAKAIYDFFWKDFCDYYLELVKPRLYQNPNDLSATPEALRSRTAAQATLVIVLEGTLRLMHPICPFITEEIWNRIAALWREEIVTTAPSPSASGSRVSPLGTTDRGVTSPSTSLGSLAIEAMESPSIMLARWNDHAPASLIDAQAEEQMRFLQEVVYAIRNIRGEMRIPPGVAVRVVLSTRDGAKRALLDAHWRFFTTLTNICALECTEEPQQIAFAASAVAEGVTVLVELPQELRERERERLEKEIARTRNERDKLEAKLSNDSFTAKAPAQVVQAEREKLDRLTDELEQMQAKAAELTRS